MCWNRLCKLKSKGMWFKKLRDFNLVLFGKQA